MTTEKNQHLCYLEMLKNSELPISFHGKILRGQSAKDMLKILMLSLKNKATNAVICDILETKIEVEYEDLDFTQLYNVSELEDLHKELIKLKSNSEKNNFHSPKPQIASSEMKKTGATFTRDIPWQLNYYDWEGSIPLDQVDVPISPSRIPKSPSRIPKGRSVNVHQRRESFRWRQPTLLLPDFILEKQQTEFFDAIKNGEDLKKMEKIMENGFANHINDSKNVFENYECTPLHWASFWDNAKAVKFLIQNGAKTDVKDTFGKIPLHSGNGIEVVKLLIESDLGERASIINAKDEFGETPLHKAAFSGKFEVVKYLVENGAQIDSKDLFDNSPIDESSNGDVKKYLIDKLFVSAATY